MSHQLSKNFSLEEFTRSQTATRKGIHNGIRIGSVEHRNLSRLCNNLLQPLRDLLGQLTVSSGYRSPALNKAIGGSNKSQHTQGLAADLLSSDLTPSQLAVQIAQHGGFDQLILEYGEWVHVSLPAEGEIARGQILTAVKVPQRFGKHRTVYVPGLHSQFKALELAFGL